MMQKIDFGRTTVLCQEGSFKKLQKKYEKCVRIIVKEDGFMKKRHQKIPVTKQSTLIQLFHDDLGDLFLTNFDEDQSLLDSKINAILIFDECFEIYLDNKKLCGKLEQLDDYSDQFFLNEQVDEDDSPAPMKRQKLSSTSTNDNEHIEFSGSDDELLNFDVPSTSIAHEMYHNIPFSKPAIDESPPLIRETKLDKKIQISGEQMRCKRLLEALLKGKRVASEQKLVPASQLILQKSLADNDETVIRLVEDAEQLGTIPEPDPITVVKTGSEFHVLSGNRRVKAFKRRGNENVPVNHIKAEDEDAFKLRRFFGDFPKDKISIEETLVNFENLLTFLHVSPQSARQWSDKDQQDVFGYYFGSHTSLSQLLKISLFPDLSMAIKQLCKNDITLGYRTLVLISSKFSVDSEQTLDVIAASCDEMSTESQFREKLQKIKATVKCTLNKKITDKQLITKLMDTFSNDDQFAEFTKKCDIRTNGSSDPFKLISKRFSIFKQKTSDTTSKKTKQVIRINSYENSDVIITHNKETMLKWIQETPTETKYGFLLGEVVESASFHFLMILPDNLGIKKKNHCLQAHMFVSMFARTHDKILEEQDISKLFQERSMTFRSCSRNDQ